MENNSVEALLKPRYKVIADYPTCPYALDDLLDEHEGEFLYSNQGKEYVPANIIDKYPHLFKRLEWHQERQKSEMPGYVKMITDRYGLTPQRKKGDVIKVIDWNEIPQESCGTKYMPCCENGSISVYDVEPATEKEYSDFQLKLAKQEDDFPLQCRLDEQQCKQECKNKNDRELCPFTSRLPYKKEFDAYFKKYYPHLIPKT